MNYTAANVDPHQRGHTTESPPLRQMSYDQRCGHCNLHIDPKIASRDCKCVCVCGTQMAQLTRTELSATPTRNAYVYLACPRSVCHDDRRLPVCVCGSVYTHTHPHTRAHIHLHIHLHMTSFSRGKHQNYAGTNAKHVRPMRYGRNINGVCFVLTSDGRTPALQPEAPLGKVSQ